ncbi:HXXEE domain-containing protein [Candidatus Woesearchaeota archaeon]|nr:HXXEE domain-containing protein [Candidatus Woesearchaeota archaeon]
MVSKKLQQLFLISIPLFVVHGLEEYWTGFYNVDPIFKIVFNSFGTMNLFQALFLLFQIMLWALFIFSYLILRKKWLIGLMAILGVVFIFEIHHLIEAVILRAYYPGSISALLFPIIGFFYWKELIKNWN